MNLEKLFQMQKELDDRILAEHPIQEGEDRLAKKILALQVELGELANCWRGFKYWSHDQEPRTVEYCPSCGGSGFVEYFDPFDAQGHIQDKCMYCEGHGITGRMPLLEEYVDALHFILSIGLELDFAKFIKDIEPIKNKNITEQFIFIFTKVGTLLAYQGLANYIHIIQNFIGLGEMLGFTWEEVEEAYMRKNAVNHHRQENGY